MASHRDQGFEIEQAVRTYLAEQGLKLIEQNYSCRMGEIDLIMQDGIDLAFIEVRYRQHTLYGDALESITVHKQRKIIKTAKYYLMKKFGHEQIYCRFDVVGVKRVDTALHFEWIKNAFTL